MKYPIMFFLLFISLIILGCGEDEVRNEYLKGRVELENNFNNIELTLQDSLKYQVSLDSSYFNDFASNDSLFKVFENKFNSQRGDSLVLFSQRQYRLFLSLKYADKDTINDTLKYNFSVIIHGFNLKNSRQRSVMEKLESQPIHANAIIWTPDSLFVPDVPYFITNKPYALFNAYAKNENAKPVDYVKFLEKIRAVFKNL